MPFAMVLGATAAASLVGSWMNADAAKDAANSQANSAANALAATTAQANQNRADLAPYRDAGYAALNRLRDLLGLPAAATNTSSIGPTGSGPGSLKNLPTGVSGQMGDGSNVGDIMPNQAGGYQQLVTDSDGNGYWVPLQGWSPPTTASAVNSLAPNSSPSADSGLLTRKFTIEDLQNDPVAKSGFAFGMNEGTKAIERRAQAMGGYDSGKTLKELTRFATDYSGSKANESYGRFRDYQDSTYGKLSGVAGLGSGATNVGVNAGTSTSGNIASLYAGLGNAQAASQIAQGNAWAGGLNGIGNSATQYALLNQLTGGGQRTVTPTDSQSQMV